MSDKPDSLASRYAPKRPILPPSPADSDPADAFSTLNPAKRQQQLMLDLRFKDRNSLGLSYSYLTSVAFNPTTGLVLEVSGYKVEIRGRNLEPLYRALLAHQVANIQEVDVLADPSPDTATVVHSIKAVKA